MVRHYLFIINPNAGNGKAGKDWSRIERLLIKRGIKYKAVLTMSPGHAMEVVPEELSLGYKTLVVVGGDGTLNEVINGIFHQKILEPEQIQLGIIPVGTGNDWARYYDLPRKYGKALDRLFNHQSTYQDVGRIRHRWKDKEEISYFVNIAGFGFDSQVVNSTNQMQERGNRAAIAYLFNLTRCLFSYKAESLHVLINGEHIHRKLFSINIGIGRYSGGGMCQTPDALADDGLFDVTIYDNMNVWKILRNVARLYNGKIKKVNTVNCYRSDKLTVYDGKGLMCETDGEIIFGDSFEIEILPLALQVLV